MQTCILPLEMKHLEAAFMEETQIPSILLMEYAARGIVESIHRHASAHDTVIFLCGPGANGGDGYASARLWAEQGGTAMILEVSNQPSGDAGINRMLAVNAGCLFPAPSQSVFSQGVLIVDALFGTGLSRKISGKAEEYISWAKESRLPCIAVDIPSGLDGETGKCLGPAVHCVETVTFHRPKTGLYLCDGPDYTGKVIVQPILIPKQYGNTSGPLTLEADDLPALIPARRPSSHKGTFGRTLIFAGSEGMAGAAAMCALSAIAAGSGLTTILCRPSLLPLLQILVPAAMCHVLPDDPEKRLEAASQALAKADRAVIGCGLSQDEELLPVLRLFRDAACPVVWDADALNLLAKHPDLLPLKQEDIITPHPAEAARILGIPVTTILDDPLSALHALHHKTGAHVLLKGACTLMTNGTQDAVNTNPCPALAKGGSGDILSGILAALLGRIQTEDALNSTLRTMQCAALIHTLAGNRAASICGEDSVTPQSVINSIHLHPSPVHT